MTKKASSAFPGLTRAARDASKQLRSVADMVRWCTSRFNEAGLSFAHGYDSAVDEALALVLHALQQLDAEADGRAERASMTKAKLAETATSVTAEAIQMHGGIGMTDEFDIGFFYKRARILETLLGDRYYHLDRFARQCGY